MIDKLQVGEYCRTAGGRIFKVSEVETFSGCNYIPKDENKTLVVSAIVKHSSNLIDIIEEGDIVTLEYKSPKCRKRITRRFEISIIEDYVNFENGHCNLWCHIGDTEIKDDICKNIKIKSIVTHEQFESVSYKVKE